MTRTASLFPYRPFRAGATGSDSQAPPCGGVSILTGPFGPVQHALKSAADTAFQAFQSSPALSGRCNISAAA